MYATALLTRGFSQGNQALIQTGQFLQHIILFSFRAYWGWRLFLTGKGKLMNHEGVVGFFTSLGIPAPELNAWFVAGVECFGGLLLLAGLFSRPVAALIAGNMLVAYLSVDADRQKLLTVFSDPKPFLDAAPFFFLLTALLVLSFGPGKISFDAVLGRSWAFRRFNAK